MVVISYLAIFVRLNEKWQNVLFVNFAALNETHLNNDITVVYRMAISSQINPKSLPD